MGPQARKFSTHAAYENHFLPVALAAAHRMEVPKETDQQITVTHCFHRFAPEGSTNRNKPCPSNYLPGRETLRTRAALSALYSRRPPVNGVRCSISAIFTDTFSNEVPCDFLSIRKTRWERVLPCNHLFKGL